MLGVVAVLALRGAECLDSLSEKNLPDLWALPPLYYYGVKGRITCARGGRACEQDYSPMYICISMLRECILMKVLDTYSTAHAELKHETLITGKC